MAKAAPILGVALATIALGGCLSVRPTVAGLYKTAECQTGAGPATPCGAEPDAVASVVAVRPAPDAAPSTAGQFSERAQAEYIKALADPRFSKDAASLRAALAASLGPSSAGAIDRRNLTRVLTVTTSKTGAFNPDDRLEQTEVTLHLTGGLTAGRRARGARAGRGADQPGAGRAGGRDDLAQCRRNVDQRPHDDRDP